MFGLKPTEMLFIAAIILLFFGAKKLPEMGKGIGEAIKNFKKSMKEVSADVDLKDDDRKDDDKSSRKSA